MFSWGSQHEVAGLDVACHNYGAQVVRDSNSKRNTINEQNGKGSLRVFQEGSTRLPGLMSPADDTVCSAGVRANAHTLGSAPPARVCFRARWVNRL